MSLHKPTVFQGVATALITPFSGGKLDRSALSLLIERQIRGGADAILVGGTTGEGSTLSPQELEELITHAKACIRDRVPLLAGCGCNNTARAEELTRVACQSGADALLAVTPYYNKATERGLTLHYRAIANAATRPVILYNVPSRTGMGISLSVYRELARHENIVAVKDASGDLSLLHALALECGDDLDIYTGNDAEVLPAVRLGARGVVSVCSNIIPRAFSSAVHLALEGEMRKAYRALAPYRALISALFLEVNPVPVKYFAALLSLCEPEYRLPLCSPSPEVEKTLRRLREELGGERDFL